jgi:hypothetical protein
MAAGEPCDDGVCDGRGVCVECAPGFEDNCDLATESCEDGVCAKLHCTDEEINGGETDLNCGGLECPPCAEGKACSQPTDCLTGVCDGGTCVGCVEHDDCEAANWCSNESCVPQKAQGDSCAEDAQCTSGHCADGVCCDDACAGECRACINAYTGAPQGECANVTNKQDPEGDCAALQGCCNGTCQLLSLTCLGS